jgi:glutamate-5-semialdehyde dehydrogenase
VIFLLQELGEHARKAAVALGKAGINEKNQALLAVAKALEEHAGYLMEENQKDIVNARENGMSEALIDRLALNIDRIAGMAEGIRQVAALEDPIG